MTAPQLPEATIRYLAENSGTTAGQMLASELLAARETIEDLQVSNSNLIAEALKNDNLRQERDAARAEVERLTAMHGVERRLAESAEARVAMLQAEVDRVAKQRDAIKAMGEAWASVVVDESLRGSGNYGDSEDWGIQFAEKHCGEALLKAIAAEQPEVQP